MLLFVFCLMIPEDRNYHFHALRLSNMLLFSEFLFILLLAPTVLCLAATNITTNQLLRDGDTLISASQDFVLGFFSPDNSTSRYVGIWYYNIPVQTVVWVANRNMPISNKDGVIEIGDDGNLVVVDGNSSSGNVYWSSNVSFVASNSSVAVLLDSGNLVLSSSSSVGDTDKAYWQSFNNPTDVFLPEMQVLVNHAVGENRAFTSWNSANDPTLGRYSMGIDPRGSPQIVIWGGSDRQWRSGYWNGLVFTGMQNTTSNYLHGFKLRTEDSKGNMYFSYTPMNSSHIVRFEITWDGIGKQWIWDPRISDWGLMQEQPDNACEFYNKCGNFGRCNVEDSSICNCLEGFEPKDSVEWNRGNWSGGCVIKLPLQCEVNGSKTDGFYKMNNAKLPDFANSVTASNADECEEKCLLNCSCTAYAMDSGFGCLIWSGDLVDIQQLSANGKILYLRLSNSELGGRIKLSNASIIAISLSVAAFTSICIWLLWSFRNSLKGSWKSNSSKLFYKTSKRREVSTDNQGSGDLFGGTNERNAPEFPLFSFNAVAVATDNFSETNVLGRGGFGPVYKGKLPSGEVVAVKKLSGKSLQGFEEFENEIQLIAKLQHRNLVRLLGWCIEEEEKILIYEYLPNKSLDYFLFAPAKRSQLDWAIRFKIIEGIARGLLYLHRDSRLTIIHRDLKASNILLDEEMNPKISDFGMARIFRGNEDELNTVRVVGTYGYMSPEYAMEGLFSVKSDVYSFGVLLLEIVSGRRNGSFQSTGKFNLVRFAWNAWTEGTPLKLVDPSLGESYSRKKVLRCIHIAMLCVQDSGSQRPPMSAVVLMLESETTTLPSPKHPIFTSVQGSEDTERWSEVQDIATSNSMSFEMASGG